MKVTPLDIQQKRFHLGFRGYDRNEVDEFLESVRDEMETLVREVTELREFRQTYEERMQEFRDREETLKNTMLTTQKVAEDMKENARKEAALVIKDAELRARQILERSQEERAKLDADILDLRRRKHHFLQDMKKVIQMHLEMVSFEETGSEVKDEQTPGQ